MDVKSHSPKISNVELLKQWEFSKICLELVDISYDQQLQMTYFLQATIYTFPRYSKTAYLFTSFSCLLSLN